jgi:hypothetical protein
MHIALTTAVLVLLTAIMLLLRIFWSLIPSRLRSGIMVVSVLLVLLQAFFAATRWGTTSDRLNVVINWLAVAAYELLVLLFSRLSPRWLTSLSALILLIPVFGASVMFPLTELFDTSSHKAVPIANNFFYQIKPWANAGNGNKGSDVIISYRPPFAPFLRHKVRTVSFNERQCNPNATVVVPTPAPETVLGRCPIGPAESAGTVDKLIPLS